MLKCIRNVEQITVERERIVMSTFGSLVFLGLALGKFKKSCSDMKSVASDVANLVKKYI